MRPTVNGILSVLAATVWVGWFGYVVWRDRETAKTKLREHLRPYRNAFRDRWISEELMDTAYAGTD